MVERRQVVETALGYLDTPFHHQGRVKGVGIDCAGLVACVARDLGLSSFDVTTYARTPNGYELKRICDREMTRLRGAFDTGDVLLFRWKTLPMHLGIVTDRAEPWGLVHCYQAVGKCVHHAITDDWRNRIVAAYRMPGID